MSAMDGAETLEESVVKTSGEQRAAKEGEPLCVVCGRYGEYICDVTEMDVCSLECRDVCRSRNHIQTQREALGVVVNPESLECGLLDTFEAMRLPSQMLLNLKELQVMQPTPIQMQTIPMALNGTANILIDAPTGTGKTIAFLIPLVARVLAERFETQELLGLIISPIRELCMQIEQELKSLVRGIPMMKTALVVGGMPLPNQLHRLKQNIQILVGTPGRLLTLHEDHHALNLQYIVCAVLDEVDMLCEKDFISPVTTLISLLPPPRQLIFVSATVTSRVQTLLDQFAPNTITISQTNVASPSVIPSHIEQHVEYVENTKKTNKLFAFLERKQENPLHATMIFVASQQGADMLVKSIFKACNLPAISIHGGKTQAERLKAMEAFVAGHATILVSTYLLGRGMDLIFVDDVIVFDMPPTVEEYIHIVGRAGRSGEPGFATVYVNEDSASLLPALMSTVWKSLKSLPKQLKQIALVEQSKVSSKVKVKELIRRIQKSNEAQSTQSSEKWQTWSQSALKRRITTSNVSSTKKLKS